MLRAFVGLLLAFGVFAVPPPSPKSPPPSPPPLPPAGPPPPANDCQVDVSGVKFDLADFAATTLTTISSLQNTYWITLCGVTTNCGGQVCGCSPAQSVCMKGNKDSLVITYGDGVVFNGVARSSIMTCNCVKDGPATLQSVVESGTGVYFVTLSGQGCCEASGGGGMGWGWLVIIIGISLFMAYCLFGAIFQFAVRKAQGTELIIHLEFWQSFPGLVTDGVRFSKDKFLTMIGKTPS